jgi:hypothetical protein
MVLADVCKCNTCSLASFSQCLECLSEIPCYIFDIITHVPLHLNISLGLYSTLTCLLRSTTGNTNQCSLVRSATSPSSLLRLTTGNRPPSSSSSVHLARLPTHPFTTSPALPIPISTQLFFLSCFSSPSAFPTQPFFLSCPFPASSASISAVSIAA